MTWVVLAGIVVAAIALVVLVGLGQTSRRVTDQRTLCPLVETPPEVVVVLLDVSDGLSTVQREDIVNQLSRVRDQSRTSARFEIYGLDGATAATLSPALVLCNPGTGADLNRLYQNPEIARKRWGEFTVAMGRAIDSLLNAPPSDNSPIFEAIQAIGSHVLSAPQFDSSTKTLVVVSDLIQNTRDGLNMYRHLPDWTAFRESVYFSRIRPDLTGVRVMTLYIDRALPRVQGGAHIDFWLRYFRGDGGTPIGVERIFGAR